MRLFQRKGWYHVEIKEGIKRSLQTKDKEIALLKMKELEIKLIHDRIVLISSSPTYKSISLDTYIKDYLQWYKGQMTFQTYERTERILEKFLKAVGGKPLAEFTEKHLEDYKDYCKGRGNKPTTINIEIRHLRGFFARAVRWRLIKENPFQYAEQIKFHKGEPRYIENISDIEKVFQIIDSKEYRLIFALYIYTGARRSEIANLEWRDIGDDYITFRERKNYEALRIPITGKLKEIFSEYTPGVGRLFASSANAIGKRIKEYLRRAGLGQLKPHDLRHTFASHLLMAGVDITAVQRLLGHSSLRTTEGYSHLLREHLKEQIKRLPY